MIIRPMTSDDVAAVQEVAADAFDELDAAQHREPMPRSPERRARGQLRIAHLQRTDPGGAWVAEQQGAIVGVALALVREGVWGLSLLTVAPAHQSAGLGGQLLEAALSHGAGCRGWIILSSDDPRALRRYAGAGFSLLPALRACGRPRPMSSPRCVYVGGPDDVELCTLASRHVRGASHELDLPVLLQADATLVVCRDQRGAGFAVARDGSPMLLAATADEVAADLLTAVLAQATSEVAVDSITHQQQWALPVVLSAGLTLHAGWAVFVKGEVGPMAPYLPSSAYL